MDADGAAAVRHGRHHLLHRHRGTLAAARFPLGAGCARQRATSEWLHAWAAAQGLGHTGEPGGLEPCAMYSFTCCWNRADARRSKPSAVSSLAPSWLASRSNAEDCERESSHLVAYSLRQLNIFAATAAGHAAVDSEPQQAGVRRGSDCYDSGKRRGVATRSLCSACWFIKYYRL